MYAAYLQRKIGQVSLLLRREPLFVVLWSQRNGTAQPVNLSEERADTIDYYLNKKLTGSWFIAPIYRWYHGIGSPEIQSSLFSSLNRLKKGYINLNMARPGEAALFRALDLGVVEPLMTLAGPIHSPLNRMISTTFRAFRESNLHPFPWFMHIQNMTKKMDIWLFKHKTNEQPLIQNLNNGTFTITLNNLTVPQNKLFEAVAAYKSTSWWQFNKKNRLRQKYTFDVEKFSQAWDYHWITHEKNLCQKLVEGPLQKKFQKLRETRMLTLKDKTKTAQNEWVMEEMTGNHANNLSPELMEYLMFIERKMKRYNELMPDQDWFNGEKTFFSIWINNYNRLNHAINHLSSLDSKNQITNQISDFKNQLQIKQNQIEKQVSIYLQNKRRETEGTIETIYNRLFQGDKLNIPLFIRETKILLRRFSIDIEMSGIQKIPKLKAVALNIIIALTNIINEKLEELNKIQAVIKSSPDTERLRNISEDQKNQRTSILEKLDASSPQINIITYQEQMIKRYEEDINKTCAEFSVLNGFMFDNSESCRLFTEQQKEFKKEIENANAFLRQWKAHWDDLDRHIESQNKIEIKKKANELLIWCSPDHHLNEGALVRKISHVLTIHYREKLRGLSKIIKMEGDADLSVYLTRFDSLKDQVEAMGKALDAANATRSDKIPSSMQLIQIPSEKQIIDLNNEFEQALERRQIENKISASLAGVLKSGFSMNCLFLLQLIQHTNTMCNVFHQIHETKKGIKNLKIMTQTLSSENQTSKDEIQTLKIEIQAERERNIAEQQAERERNTAIMTNILSQLAALQQRNQLPVLPQTEPLQENSSHAASNMMQAASTRIHEQSSIEKTSPINELETYQESSSSTGVTLLTQHTPGQRRNTFSDAVYPNQQTPDKKRYKE